MRTLDNIVDGLIAQLPAVRAKKKELARQHIRDALKCVELHELIEMANDIYAEQFAQGEIAAHHTIQQQGKINETLRN